MHEHLSPADADALAASWVAAWNAHDLGAIVDHYRDDVEYHSPFVAALVGSPGRLRGLEAVSSYIAAALDRYPDLHFEAPSTVAVGSHSLSMVYRSVNDLTAVETLVLDRHGKVARALCHYRGAS